MTTTASLTRRPSLPDAALGFRPGPCPAHLQSFASVGRCPRPVPFPLPLPLAHWVQHRLRNTSNQQTTCRHSTATAECAQFASQRELPSNNPPRLPTTNSPRFRRIQPRLPTLPHPLSINPRRIRSPSYGYHPAPDLLDATKPSRLRLRLPLPPISILS